MLLYLKIITHIWENESFKNRYCKFHPKRWNWSRPCQYVYNGAGAWVAFCSSPATSFPYSCGMVLSVKAIGFAFNGRNKRINLRYRIS
jgi:hypothetical protein